MKKILLSLLLFAYLFADTNTSQGSLSLMELRDISSLETKLSSIDEQLDKNIWIKRYKNYLLYKKMEKELEVIQTNIDKVSKKKRSKQQTILNDLKGQKTIKLSELELVQEYKFSPIGDKIKPKPIDKPPKITNPFAIIEALSYIRQHQNQKLEYTQAKIDIYVIIKLLTQKRDIISKMDDISDSKYFNTRLEDSIKVLSDFEKVNEIVNTTEHLYSKKIERVIAETNATIKDELYRSLRIFLLILVLFVLFMGVKRVFKKYIEDDDRHYTINKIINFVLVILTVFILLFSYIENASYLVTILGFASAGIAIALKDWFMSIFGWMVIMTSGSINVGDRIKVTKNGLEVVGDVLDISVFKISVREDITLTSYMKNRRTGRVFFIPNNYVFTDLIANYTYDNMRTVWDGIDLYITFESNHEKAVALATEVTRKHSMGYTELAKKRLDKLRTKYVLRSSNPEPRIYAFLEPYGVVISSWYMTNSYATLSLRSKVSMAILEEFKKADDIHIAYPTQTLRVGDTKMASEAMLPGVHTGFFDSI